MPKHFFKLAILAAIYTYTNSVFIKVAGSSLNSQASSGILLSDPNPQRGNLNSNAN